MKQLAKKYIENVPLVTPSEYVINGRDSQLAVLCERLRLLFW